MPKRNLKLLYSIPNQTNSRNPTCRFHIQQRRIYKSSKSQLPKINPILIPSWRICYIKFWLFISSRENGNVLSSTQKLQQQATEEAMLYCCQEVNCFWNLERKNFLFFQTNWNFIRENTSYLLTDNQNPARLATRAFNSCACSVERVQRVKHPWLKKIRERSTKSYSI